VAIETICTGCGQKLSVADENAGKRARCPACGNVYTIPAVSQLPTASQTFTPAPDSNFTGSSAPLQDTTTSSTPDGLQYWMRAVDGNEYGPVDQFTLQRWFREGRVGPGYQIRTSEFGNWQAAELFRPSLPQSSASLGGNPGAGYSAADANSYSPVDPALGMYRYPKADPGVKILILGILGFVCCPVFGVAAWIMGHTALNDIAAGRVDPNSKGLVQAGYYIGIASVLINILCLGGSFVLRALSLVGGGM
jgi:hypothetical protein